MNKRCFIALKKAGTQEFKVASYGDNYMERMVLKENIVELRTKEKISLPIYNVNEEYDLDSAIFLEIDGLKETAYMFKVEEGAIVHTRKRVGRTLDIDFSKFGKGEFIQASLGNLFDVNVTE